ncbi:MAG: hypothetical protein ACRCY8_02875 [Dermatophilaceae bacterium]
MPDRYARPSPQEANDIMLDVMAHEPDSRVRAASVIAPSARFRAGVVVVVVVALVWRWWTLAQWSWYQDDWVHLQDAVALPFTEYVLQDYNGHLMPAQFVLTWLGTRVAPLEHSYAVVVSTTVILAALIAWVLALRELFGERGRLLYAIVLLAFSPLVAPVTLWWAASLQTFPLIATQGLVILFVARSLLRGDRRRDRLALVLVYLVGLSFWEKAVLVVIPAAFVAVIVADGTFSVRLRRAAVLLRPVALVTVAYLVVYLALTDGDAVTGTLEPRDLGDGLTFIRSGVLDIGLPSLLGGPWPQSGSSPGIAAMSSTGVAVLSATLIVVGGALVCRFRRDGWLAVAMCATYAATAWGLLLASSRFDALGVLLVLDGRYSADILPIALLAVTFAVTPLRVARRPALTRVPRTGLGRLRTSVLLVGAAASAAALFTSAVQWTGAAPLSPKPWVDALISDTRDVENVSVHDSVAPSHVIDPAFFGRDARLSSLIGPLDADLRWNEAAETIYVVDWGGRLKEGQVGPTASNAGTGPVEGCGYPVAPGRSVTIPMTRDLFRWEWGMQVDYFSDGAAILEVGTDSTTSRVQTTPGPHRRQLVVTDAITQAVTIESLAGSSTVCVTGVRAGQLEASNRWIGDISRD